jgi:hypothetical protein
MTNLEKLSINFLAELKGYQFDLWDSIAMDVGRKLTDLRICTHPVRGLANGGTVIESPLCRPTSSILPST